MNPIDTTRITMVDIEEKVLEITSKALGVDAGSIGSQDALSERFKLDSLQAMEILAKVEDEFSVLIPDDEYFKCKSVSQIAKLVTKALGLEQTEGETERERPRTASKKRITDFASSREYAVFLERKKSIEKLGNPYFIKHDSKVADTSVISGRKTLNFGSYNYVCLSGDPETVEAAREAASLYGTSASGSRLLAGDKSLYRQLEAEIADWKHTEDAIVMVSGHATNVTTVGCLCNENDLILYDILSHNSITQGCQLSKSMSKSFPHNDFDALESLLKEHRDEYEKVLLIVEGVYSMDGDIAPIPEFVKLKKKYGLLLMVDEAHSTCVLGEHGGGVDDYFGLAPDDIDIKMGTLSKGLGTCGGYIAGSKQLVEWLMYNAPGFVFSVGISPVLAAACLAGIRKLRRDATPVKRLHSNIAYFMAEARKRKLDTVLAGETPIVPIMIGPDEQSFALSVKMLEKGVFVPPAVYPAVPKGKSRLRFCICSEHEPWQIDLALDELERTAKELGIQLPRK